jgi:hypothetical protein
VSTPRPGLTGGGRRNDYCLCSSVSVVVVSAYHCPTFFTSPVGTSVRSPYLNDPRRDRGAPFCDLFPCHEWVKKYNAQRAKQAIRKNFPKATLGYLWMWPLIQEPFSALLSAPFPFPDPPSAFSILPFYRKGFFPLPTQFPALSYHF